MDKFHTEAIKNILTYASICTIELNEDLSSEIKDKMLEDLFGTFKFTSQTIIHEYIENDYSRIVSMVQKHTGSIDTEPSSICQKYWYMVGDNLLSDDFDYICELYSERSQ